MSEVLVLNAGYEPLHRVTLRHAIGMLVRQVAVIEEHDETMYGPYPRPKVLRLVRYVVMRWVHRGVPACTKANVHARDQACVYCGGAAETVDHVLPRSRGGDSGWLNLVAACARCNRRKANRTPAEANMPMRSTPYIPTFARLQALRL